MKFQTSALPNGIRLIHLHHDSPVAHCGLLINAGSRDELEHEHGLAHFIEHVLFKGTKTRKVFHINSRLEDVGGELNAYTTKEETCVHASFLSSYYERSMELIQDIVFNSVFPEKELEKEKVVVIDEINSYKDSPAELIYDDFEELIFDRRLGRNILGTPRSVKKLGQKHIFEFISRNYHTDQMVFSSVGKIDFSRLEKLFHKYFAAVPENRRKIARPDFVPHGSLRREIKKKTYQAHCVLGGIAYNLQDKKRIPLLLLNNILGGTGMNSRLNMSLREKHGLVYDVESTYTPYSDVGTFTIYFATEHEQVEQAIQLIYNELNKLKTKKLGVLQLSKAKKQFVGQLAIASENKESLMLAIGRSHLYLNVANDFNKFAEKIEAVSTSELLEVANEIFELGDLSRLIYR